MSLAQIPLARETLAEMGRVGDDFDAPTFFEAYARKIEEQGERQISPEVRRLLLDGLEYFKDPSSNYQEWDQDTLRAYAMLAPVEVAAGLFLVERDLLERAIKSQRPNRAWPWWRALGAHLLSGFTDEEISEGLDVHQAAVAKYRAFLFGG